MTLNQLKALEPEQRYSYLDKMVELRRPHLNKCQHIMRDGFRYCQKDGWPVYVRPTDTKINRDYDYSHGTWKFLYDLEMEVRNIDMTSE